MATEPQAKGSAPKASGSAASGSAASGSAASGSAASGSAASRPAASRPAASRLAISVRALIVLALVAIVAYGLDQFTKYLIVSNMTEQEQVKVIGQFLQFHFVKNSGAAFSLASGSTWIFSIAASAVTIFIIGFARRIRSVGWAVLFGMLLGGTTGNLTDRLFREPGFGVGHVIDFIQVQGFPAIFNIADSFIVASMGLFIILTIRGIGFDGRRVSDRDATARSDSLMESDHPSDITMDNSIDNSTDTK